MYLWKGSVPPSSTFVADFFLYRQKCFDPPPPVIPSPFANICKIHTVEGRSDLRTPGDLQVQ